MRTYDYHILHTPSYEEFKRYKARRGWGDVLWYWQDIGGDAYETISLEDVGGWHKLENIVHSLRKKDP